MQRAAHFDVMDYIDDELAALLGVDPSTTATSFNDPPPPQPPPAGKTSDNSNRKDLVSAALITTKKGGRLRPASQGYDHIAAERKRRELLSQQFLALSALVPGLKKMDKSSILGDAISHIKQLQERVKTLEERAGERKMESTVVVRRSQIMAEEERCFGGGSSDFQPFPEIEVRVCNRDIHLNIQCQSRKGVVVKIICELEKLNLAVLTTTVTTVGDLALDIVITAEMGKEFCIPAKDVVTTIGSALLV